MAANEKSERLTGAGDLPAPVLLYYIMQGNFCDTWQYHSPAAQTRASKSVMTLFSRADSKMASISFITRIT